MRLPDWDARLDDYLRRASQSSFQPGVHDCALFAAGALAAMTGLDHARDLRGRYTTLIEGRRLLRAAMGSSSLCRVIEQCLGLSVHDGWAQARRGDLALVRDSSGQRTLGIVDLSGERVALAGNEGLVFMPLSAIVKAWKV